MRFLEKPAEGGIQPGQGLMSVEIHFHRQCPVAAGDDSRA